MKLELLPYDLELAHTFRISREAHDIQPTLIVKLSFDGLYGLGETTSNPYYGTTISSMTTEIEAKRVEIEAHSISDPAEFYDLLQFLFPDNSFVRCALDMAAHDLHGKMEN